eukprot:comp23200_c0_seq1/m.37689 comp23200_c0_seq1/g.37689  ORF comp23200_c0_seq1/g.37689 comp23200_c0_seq1/m.37689 type:complete len:244 (-) comp23200_c0_seq1:314-1045(-)
MTQDGVAGAAEGQVFHTGNVLKLVPTFMPNPVEELTQALRLTHGSDADGTNTTVAPPDLEHCRSNCDCAVTVKVFLYAGWATPAALDDCLCVVGQELGWQHVDLLILALPNNTDLNTHPDLAQVVEAAAKLRSTGTVGRLGLSDFLARDLQRLQDLGGVVPDLVQVNVDTCCSIPDDLKATARAHNIDLVSHADPPVIMHKQQLGQALGGQWQPMWVARYTVSVKSRAVIAAKGYIVKAIPTA